MYFTTIIKQTKLLLSLSACIAMVCMGTAQAQTSGSSAGPQNVNVDLFRGGLNASIPLYTFNTRCLSIPISLNYTPVDTKSNYSVYTNNIPASDGHVYHPGWVGLGWSLSAGGSITRSIKGIPDETNTGKTEELLGNFFNYDIDYNPINTPVPVEQYDVDEDEFSFNFAGYSGTFFYYRGEWKVFSKQTFKIHAYFDNEKLYGFLMETPDGINYTFGNYNNSSQDEEAIEYSSSENSKNEELSWYLVRIESPEGDQINFNYGYNFDESKISNYTPIQKQCTLYSRLEVQPNIGKNIWETSAWGVVMGKTTPTDEEVANGSVRTYNFPVYLKSITSPSSQVKIEFDKVIFDEMFYPEYKSAKAYKLEKIRFNISGETNNFKEYTLNYTGGVYATGQPTELLKLLSIQESGCESSLQSPISLPATSFDYYPDSDETSPNALSQINYSAGSKVSIEYLRHGWVSNQLVRGLIVKRKTVTSSATDDALIYDYYYCKEFPDSYVNNNSPSGSTGTLSRNEIYSQESYSKIFPVENTVARYYMTKTTQYDCAIPSQESIKNTTVLPLQVGYSDVWEARSSVNSMNEVTKLGYTSNSYINYTTIDDSGRIRCYNNNDIVGTPISIKDYNAALELITSTTFEYEDVNAEQQGIQRYTSIVSTFKDESGVERSVIDFGGYTIKHTQYRLVSKITQTPSLFINTQYKYVPGSTYDIAEVKDVDLNYDNYTYLHNLEDTPGASYSTRSTTYKYTSEFSNWWGTNQWDANSCHRQVDLPVEKVMMKDGRVVGAELIKYETIEIPAGRGRATKILKPSMLYFLEINTPIDTSSYQSVAADWSTKDSRFKLKATYKYDDKGNLLQYQDEGSLPITYDYDQENGLPLIEIKGLTYNDYYKYKSEEFLYPNKSEDVNRLRIHFPLTQITSYSIDPRFGVTSVTTPNGISIYNEFDAFGRLRAIKDTNKKLLKSIEYNHNVQ